MVEQQMRMRLNDDGSAEIKVEIAQRYRALHVECSAVLKAARSGNRDLVAQRRQLPPG